MPQLPARPPVGAVTVTNTQLLQQRLGNQGTQAFVARTLQQTQGATALQAPQSKAAPIRQIQAKASTVTEQLTPVSPQTQVVKPAATTAGSVPGKEPAVPGAKAAAAAPGPASAQQAPSATAKPGVKPEMPKSAKAGGAPAGGKAPIAGKAGTGKAGEAKGGAPNARAALAPAIAAVQNRASGARKHSAPSVSVASAQAAAINPQVEQKRAAATQTVANLDAAKAEEIKRNEFKAKLKQAIEAATPKPTTESEADKVMKTGATQASGVLRGQLATERDAATGPMQAAASTEVPASSQPAPPAANLQSEPVGPPPAPVSAAPVVPAPLPLERLDYSSDRGSTDQVMVENNVTKEQMQEGNDPAFGPTLEARATAEKHEATAEAKYRQSENKVQEQAQANANQALAKDLSGIHGAREQQIGKVVSQQMGTKAKDAQERQRITDTINSIKDNTRADVEAILGSMEKEASDIFEAGLKRAEKAYEDTFEEAKGGIGTWLTTWGSDWEKLIEKSLAKARKEYLNQVDVAIDEVSTFVDNKLKAAKQRVADGRNEVDNFVKGLDASVKQFGEEALQAVSADFDTMGSDIDQRRDGLINKLTEQYKASYERMSAKEQELREANKSLWQRVYDATVGLIKKIIAFKDMLLGILGRAVAVIGDIIAHPIRFLGNLVTGVMQGLKNFMSKIGSYLLKGLMDWLFGALAGAGLQLPDSFDLKGIISIVLQILGLTYANFRSRAVAIVGEPVVAAIEKTAEVFKVIVTEGIPGLWRFIKEQLANLKSMVLDAIFDYIKEKVIMAGITWIIGLLNPASAFFKACKAIYDIVMFFINRGSQILALVNAVIDSMAAIAQGAVGVAAGFVENALAKAIPVAIGFLASLLGLGDPSKPVKEFIEKARAPVNKAIDWVINLAVKAVKAAGKFVGGLFGKKDKNGKTEERTEEQMKTDLQQGLAMAELLLAVSEPDLDMIREKLPGIKSKFKLSVLELVVDSTTSDEETVHFYGKINPEDEKPKHKVKRGGADSIISEADLSFDRFKWRSSTKKQLRTLHVEMGGSKDIMTREGTFKSAKKWHRRHVVPWGNIRDHFIQVFAGKTVKKAAEILSKEGVNTKIERGAVVREIKALARTAFNDVINLFIDLGQENSALQDVLDDAHPEFLDKKGRVIEQRVDKKVADFITKHAIGGYDFKVTTSVGVIDWEVTYE